MHIPFCLRKCPYCDFYSVVAETDLDHRYVQALRVEISRLADHYGALPLRSLYLGGGTPTILPVGLLAELITVCGEAFELRPNAEITCEANPGTISRQALRELRAAGVTRISVGVQSLRDDELQFLGRVHTAAEARRAVTDAQDVGFQVVSVDLIYCLPGQTRQAWEATLDEVCRLEPDHVSAYCLQIEEETPLGKQVARGQVTPLSQEDQSVLYRLTANRLREAGIMQYEISNYARPGAECIHNLTYWRNEPYLGVGAGAWSYVDGERRQNVADVQAYIDACDGGQPPVGFRERCVGARAADETLMLGLRLTEGLDLNEFRRRHNVDLVVERADVIARLETEGLAKCARDRLVLTARGMAIATEITAAMALSEKEEPPRRRSVS